MGSLQAEVDGLDKYFMTLHALTDAWTYLSTKEIEQLEKMKIEVDIYTHLMY